MNGWVQGGEKLRNSCVTPENASMAYTVCSYGLDLEV